VVEYIGSYFCPVITTNWRYCLVTYRKFSPHTYTNGYFYMLL